MSELFGEKRLLTKTFFEEEELLYGQTKDENYGTVDGKEALIGKVVCLFFSASWCAPCQHFVHSLREMYTDACKRGESLEIVFLSFDKTEEEMLNYYKNGHGDWLALPFGDTFKETLAEKYSISVIPKLIVIQPNGAVITSKGRKDIQDKGIICVRLWRSVLTHAEHKEEHANEQIVAPKVVVETA